MTAIIPAPADWIKDKAISFEPENNTVITAENDTITYDYLIVAPGLKLETTLVEG
ncbi:hypothetical protein [Lacinutrix sp. Hel_I_90]|uniref:hypothetical protein n=1 Tax=Lacinutrix sp. Hel_I_90 TaxID=1249999 RepID=UPI0026F3A8DE|nr:hypothetical protein [Lacinutrix sp. Hel_I_90]